MDQAGIDRTWLSWEAPEDEYDPVYKTLIPDPGPDGPIAFRHCLDFYNRAPDRFVLDSPRPAPRPDALPGWMRRSANTTSASTAN